MTSIEKWHPVLRISWVPNRDLIKKNYQQASSSTISGFSGAKILWRWSRALWSGDPVCFTCFKNLLVAPFLTPVIRAISTCWCLSRESLTMSCNISPEIWCGIFLTLQNPDQKVVSTEWFRVNLITFPPAAHLTPWCLINMLIQSCMKCIQREIPSLNPCRPLPEIYIFKEYLARTCMQCSSCDCAVWG